MNSIAIPTIVFYRQQILKCTFYESCRGYSVFFERNMF